MSIGNTFAKYLAKNAFLCYAYTKVFTGWYTMFTKFKNLFVRACVLFTFITFLLYLIGYIIVSKTITLNLLSVVSLFAFCMLLCLLNNIFKLKKVALGIRIVLHYFLVLASTYIIFGLIGNIVSTSLASLFMLAIVTLVYSIVVLIFVLSKKSENSENTEYSSMFRK